MNWIQRAQLTLQLESQAIEGIMALLDASFESIGELILNLKGRVIITGIGKSAIIAQKIVATFNSTGTPAVFMHAADAIHGDLGLVQKQDVVLCISKSGNSPEIKALTPLIKSLGIPLIGMVGNRNSHLAQQSDWILDTTVAKEACPLDLAPTSSTAAQMALGDALATCLMEARGFQAKDFAQVHPGGALGRRLYTRLADLVDQDRAPQVEISATLEEIVLQMSAGRCGATAVLDGDKVVGIITDGDLRRHLERSRSQTVTASDLMNASPKLMHSSDLAVKAFQILEQNAISQVIITEDEQYVGMVHLHDILREGIF
ncbi:MAG TPA: D-arabinose 5-phosphate isomerase [Flavobacteriales bacterium]|nr:D-arabinose 5-phosphate isomerase [Flavobacteriales bacterium]